MFEEAHKQPWPVSFKMGCGWLCQRLRRATTAQQHSSFMTTAHARSCVAFASVLWSEWDRIMHARPNRSHLPSCLHLGFDTHATFYNQPCHLQSLLDAGVSGELVSDALQDTSLYLLHVCGMGQSSCLQLSQDWPPNPCFQSLCAHNLPTCRWPSCSSMPSSAHL